jgi:hypothetical protein
MQSKSARNLYEILGVTPGCSPEALRKAYLQKARECHPDRNPNDPHATRKFQQVSHAYDILQSQSTSTSRSEFDEQAYEHVFECMTVDEYKAMFEKLSQKAVTFYNNHREEIQLAKSLWSSFKSNLSHFAKEDHSHVVDNEAENEVFSEDEEEEDEEDEDNENEMVQDAQGGHDATAAKPPPLIFTIRVSHGARQNKEYHKVEYVRYRWHPERKHLDEESCAVLVPVEHEEVTFPGEGDCYAMSRVAGDVIIFVNITP